MAHQRVEPVLQRRVAKARGSTVQVQVEAQCDLPPKALCLCQRRHGQGKFEAPVHLHSPEAAVYKPRFRRCLSCRGP